MASIFICTYYANWLFFVSEWIRLMLDDSTFLQCNINRYLDDDETASIKCGPYPGPPVDPVTTEGPNIALWYHFTTYELKNLNYLLTKRWNIRKIEGKKG
jgi:hypothetical protein